MKTIRKYAPIVFLLIGCMFVVSCFIDECADYKCVQQDLCVEAAVEFDVDDLEWNEGDDVDGWYFACNVLSSNIQYVNIVVPVVSSDIHRSSEQWMGLVRKHSPRKNTALWCQYMRYIS